MKSVFVIIVTYNGKQWYDRCFTSLRLSKIPLHVIVVDNASSDDAVEYIQQNYPEIYLIRSEINLGFGQGNNKGICHAIGNNADYVFLLNQDAWIEPDTIKKLVEIHQNRPEYGILSPIHLNADKTEIEKGLMHYILDYHITSPRLINDLYFQKLSDIYETNYVNAAAWLLPRKTLEIVGGFDPIFFHYGEDDNYMQRVQYHGMKIGICPQTTICHDTENRIQKSINAEQSRRKSLLVYLTNINRPANICSSIINDITSFLLKVLQFKFSVSQICLSDAFYKLKLKNKINDSINKNSQKGPSWIEE